MCGLLKDCLSVGGNKDQFGDAVREMERSDRVGRQLVDVVRVQHQVYEDGEELEQHQAEMDARVDLGQQHRTAGEAEHKVAENPHQPDVRLQIGHQTGMFGGLHLHLFDGERLLFNSTLSTRIFHLKSQNVSIYTLNKMP